MTTDRDHEKRRRRLGRPSAGASTSEKAPLRATNSHPIMRAAGGWAEFEEADDLVVEIYLLRRSTDSTFGFESLD